MNPFDQLDPKGQKMCTVSGNPINVQTREIDPDTGMQRDYVVLCPTERAKGFIRPYRDSYIHVGMRPIYPLRDLTPDEQERYKRDKYVAFEKYPDSDALVGRFWTKEKLESGCGSVTTMGRALSETFARDPSFHGATFCSGCKIHLPLEEFQWLDGERVGS